MKLGTVHSKSVGKTTTLVHLAAWLSEYGFDVAGIDADWQNQFKNWLRDAAPNIPCVAVSEPHELEDKADELAEKHDVVLVDGPAGLHLTPGAVMMACDTVIVPCGPTAPEIDALAKVEKSIRQIQRIREEESETAKPFPIIVPVKTKRRTIATRVLLEEAKKLGFQSTEHTIPYSETYATLMGLQGNPSRLMWQLGRSKEVREAVLNLDALFKEMLPEAAEDDPELFARMMATPLPRKRRKKMRQMEEDGQSRFAATG